MTTVAVTGATGIFGQALCDRLDADPAVEGIVGIARRPIDPRSRGWAKVVFRPADVTDPDAVAAVLDGVDVVCHLAFIVTGQTDRATMRRINVEGTRTVVDAAAAAGVRRIVYASSIAAYGAHPDNPVPIREDHPTRGNPGFAYGEDKAAVEALLDDFVVEHPRIEVARIRPCVVVGPNSTHLFRGGIPAPLAGLLTSRLLRWPLPDPGVAPFQLVHEDDVAEVFARAITAPTAHGAYNLAGGGTATWSELAQALGAWRVAVPEPMVRRAVDVAHRLRLSPADGSWASMLTHPIVVDTTRARQELGWVPAFDTRTALDDQLRCLRAATPGLR